MRCKWSKIIWVVFLLNTTLFQASPPSKDKEINELYSSISKSLESNDNYLVYRHILKSVSSDGSLVVFDDGMSITVSWWYRSGVKKWKGGDQLYLHYDFDYRQIRLEHLALSMVAWGAIHSYPSPPWAIRSLPNGSDNPDRYSKIVLDNDFVFKSVEPLAFGNGGWKVGDRVFVLANSNGFYQVWNRDKKAIISSEFTAHLKQKEREPVKIGDVLGLEKRLNAKVLQQPEATRAVASSLLNYAAGLKDQDKPIGVFLFIGPTGVGKTELAKVLACEMYNDSQRLLRFDMSHFTESHSVSRLIGSPPGYVNHEESGQLTSPLLDNPQRVVLLDEIEKAHPNVVKAFLPVFDEGFILNNKNKLISCSETVFVMTSNLCANKIIELYNRGYSSQDILGRIEPELMQALSPELYNRVEPILFEPLAKETMEALVDLMLEKVGKRLEVEKNLHIHIDPSLKSFLVQNGYHPLLGARPLKKLIEKRVLSTLAAAIIRDGIEEGSELILLYDEGSDSVMLCPLE